MSALRSRSAIHFHSPTSAGSGTIGPSCVPPNTWTISSSIRPPGTARGRQTGTAAVSGQVTPISSASRRFAASAALSPGCGWLQQALVHNPPEWYLAGLRRCSRNSPALLWTSAEMARCLRPRRCASSLPAVPTATSSASTRTRDRRRSVIPAICPPNSRLIEFHSTLAISEKPEIGLAACGSGAEAGGAGGASAAQLAAARPSAGAARSAPSARWRTDS